MYNPDTGFSVFNAKEDVFKILRDVLGDDYNELLYSLIPGMNPALQVSYTRMGDLLRNLPADEMATYNSIMVNTNCVNAADREEILNLTFSEYSELIAAFNIITIPSYDVWSICSLYIPNSIMLPHLDMLDVLSESFNTAVVVGQKMYPTPNIYYQQSEPSNMMNLSNWRDFIFIFRHTIINRKKNV